MGRGAYGGGSGVEQNMQHRFDPNLYSHLPPHQQPLPDDVAWAPPPSTLDLVWGLTQTSYDTPAQVHNRGGGMGPMSALLSDERGGGRLPLDLHPSPTTTMDVSRTVLIQRSGESAGSNTQTMEGTAFDEGISQHQANRVSFDVASQGGPRASVLHHPPSPAASMQEGRADVTSVAESPRCVECIVCRFNSLRANSDGEGARPDSVASDTDFVDVDDNDGEDDEEEVVVVKEATAGGKTKQASNGRGKAKAKDKEGDKNGERGWNGGWANWNLNESLVLVQCKKDQDDHFANVGHNYA
ncbi:hypothetical protein CBR_g3944 [Chara braunii]|uniref:Uncharacterized protein n=1 Tax=Chara braunii TaxID=69332 RepID=A0A388KGQ5_CHABU|nr:hypothetical protein CBR_g3944 [Chara braunii]|eukprot:GBG69245.1 hypothetical protein CBR_g3944 [Chara braunii]